ncbi:uncharacterized protein LOC112612251 [Theropithecus gelada]|uniref:uncharacterized protein LOC112612251 n=1 Tax=Theropithecus gelada TaxID=9565 RepID=UPI000DC17A71|nr:uncharacterized protein LOC112612251 [Theropithecus gelada]
MSEPDVRIRTKRAQEPQLADPEKPGLKPERSRGGQPSPHHRARQEQQLQMAQTNPLRRRSPAPLPWQPSRAGEGGARSPGNSWAAAARVSCAGNVGEGAVPYHTSPAPSRRRFFGGSAFPRPPTPSAAFPPFRV